MRGWFKLESVGRTGGVSNCEGGPGSFKGGKSNYQILSKNAKL
jgi:hypothetical protein